VILACQDHGVRHCLRSTSTVGRHEPGRCRQDAPYAPFAAGRAACGPAVRIAGADAGGHRLAQSESHQLHGIHRGESRSITSEQAERLVAGTERIAGDVGAIASNFGRLTDLVRQIESKLDQGRAPGWRETAIVALTAGVDADVLTTLIEAERLDPTSYELWLLYLLARASMREPSVLARFPHTTHDELWRAARYAATDRTIAPERRVAVLCGLTALAGHHAASDVSGFAMEKAVATLTEPGVVTLRNAPALLFPLRQLATGPLAGATRAADAALEAVYETAERQIAARCNLDSEAPPDATLEADANELLAAATAVPRARAGGAFQPVHCHPRRVLLASMPRRAAPRASAGTVTVGAGSRPRCMGDVDPRRDFHCRPVGRIVPPRMLSCR
jgi:hypothetical protein